MTDLETSHAEPSDSPGFLLWRVTNAWQRAIRDVLAPFDLTHVQFVLLASLTWIDEAEIVTQRGLSDFAGIDVMMTSQVVRTLESKGMLTREAHPHDNRARVVRRTPVGTELANRATAAVEAADHMFFAPLDDAVRDFAHHLRELDAVHLRQTRGGKMGAASDTSR